MFGASGGGFASLYYAAHYPGAVAVPINPQTNLANYLRGGVDRYGHIGWGLSGLGLAPQIPAATDLIQLYRRSRDVSVLYLQNRNDLTHISGHFDPFMNGLPDGHRVRPILVDGPQGHHPPKKEVTKAVLSAAITGEELARMAS